MILLDTHIWVWWVNKSPQITPTLHSIITSNKSKSFGVSIISCWEIAKLVEYRRLKLKYSVQDWLDKAIAYPNIRLLDLTPQIATVFTQLPGDFHRDPADQIIVATARVHEIPLLTKDKKIQRYSFIKTLPEENISAENE